LALQEIRVKLFKDGQNNRQRNPGFVFFSRFHDLFIQFNAVRHQTGGLRKDLELFPLAECACCYGACYARRMRLLPWYLLCTPNAPADVAPAMHAECACYVRF